MLISGLRFATKSDIETLEIGLKIWEALYAYFKYCEVREKFSSELSKLSRSKQYRFIKEKVMESLRFY